MKKKLIAALALLLVFFAASAWLWYRFNGGVSHSDLISETRAEGAAVRDRVETRYRDIDKRLDRIEGKIDRLLKIADRPLPDGMRKTE
ncbi:MAG: hypothetical protein J6T01_06425 [Kiritimatiellae bacterium]|nr:hypothetical protein [Kiritimatiellia bacterium]